MVIRGFLAVMMFVVGTTLCAQQMLRVEKMQYATNPLHNNSPLDFSVPHDDIDGYELLAGETRLGEAQPIVYVRNVTDSVITSIKIRFRLLNTITGKIVYNTSKALTVNALRDSTLTGIQLIDEDWNPISDSQVAVIDPLTHDTTFQDILDIGGIRPNAKVKCRFPPFEGGGFIDDKIGRIQSCVIIENRDSNNVPYPNPQSEADTVCNTFYSLRRLNEFSTGSPTGEFHQILSDSILIPSVLRFVSRGVTIVDGSMAHFGSERPGVELAAANNQDARVKDPVMMFNRTDTLGQTFDKQFRLDTLRSFPINVAGKPNCTLHFAVKRGPSGQRSDRKWNQDSLLGPEGRIENSTGVFSRADRLIVEYAVPSSDGLNGITNIPEHRWLQLCTIDGAWRFDVKDTSAPSDTANKPLLIEYANGADHGKFGRYDYYTIPIPSDVFKWHNEGGRNFRFRFRNDCVDHSNGTVIDDDDPFFVRSICFSDPNSQYETPDIELADIELQVPYSVAPYQITKAVPARVLVVNTRSTTSQVNVVRLSYNVRVGNTVQEFNTNVPVPALSVGESVWLNTSLDVSPVVNSNEDVRIRMLGYFIQAEQYVATWNDTIRKDFNVRFDNQLAYDNVEQEGFHKVALEKGAINGVNFGLRLRPTNGGDFIGSRYGGQFTDGYANPGWLTMRFTTNVPLGISGYSVGIDQGYESDAEFVFDIVDVEPTSAMESPNSIQGSVVSTKIGIDAQGYTFNRLANYPLSAPITLQPGTYWLRVYQPGNEPLNVCATEARAGTLVQSTLLGGDDGFNQVVDPSWGQGTETQSSFPFGAYSSTRDHKYFVGSNGVNFYTWGDEHGTTTAGVTGRRGTWVPVLRLNTTQPTISNVEQKTENGEQNGEWKMDHGKPTFTYLNSSKTLLVYADATVNQLNIYSVTGSLVYSSNSSVNNVVDCSKFTSGAFVASATTLNGIYTYAFVNY